NSKEWAQFRGVSARLVEYYTSLTNSTRGEAKAVAECQRIFHLLGKDEQEGFAEFQTLFRAERYRYRFGSCEALIKLVREYQPILSEKNNNWLDYHEAKLTLDLHHHETARCQLEGLIERHSVAADPALFARCLFRLANALREARDFQGARQVYIRLK